MYFTMSEVKTNHGAQFSVLAAHLAGEKILAGENIGTPVHAIFEAAVMHVSNKTKLEASTIAAQLLNQDSVHKQQAIRVGMAELSRVLGGKEKTLAYFRQIDAPRAKIRFESVGGVQHDILTAKNRIAVLAMTAQGERFKDPKHDGLLPMERDLVDFAKSVRRTVEEAIQERRVEADFGHDLVLELEQAAIVDKRPANKQKMEMLLFTVTEELYDERIASVRAQYKPAEKLDPTDDGPSIH